jgi:toxin ParE1/3/4
VSLPLVLRPEAEADIVANRDWYNQQRDDLGDSFVNAVRELVNQIKGAPEQFAVSFRSVRRAKTRRFPYIVYYRVLDDRIEIIAVLHASRDPRIWQRRV